MKAFLSKFSVILLFAGFFASSALARTDREACQMFLRASKAKQLRLVKNVERDRLDTIRACKKLIRLGRDWARPTPKPSPVPRPSEPTPDDDSCTSSPPCGHNRFCYHGRCVIEGAAYCSSNGECYGAEKCVDRVCK
jgi:hypothetical protein